MTDLVATKPYKVGILCNPLSGRVRKKLTDIRAVSGKLPKSIYREASNKTEFQATLDEFAQEEIGLLVVISGDGTFHAVLTYIFSSNVFKSVPVLCPIPAGTTNMTAHDFGISGKPTKLLCSLVASLPAISKEQHIQRSVLKVSQHGATPLYGFFFGTGLIVDGVKFFKKRVRKTGMTGESASGIVMLRYLLSLLFDSSSYRCSLSINAKDLVLSGSDCLVMFASTLDRLLMGTRPYWGKETSPVHTTVVRQSPIRLWYFLIPLILGRGQGLEEKDGYLSRNLDTLAIDMQGDFIIDGEIYSIEKEYGSLEVTAKDTISVLTNWN